MKFRTKIFPLGLGALLVGLAGTAHATGILELYRDARADDPQYAAAESERAAAETLVPQALGQLLPQVGFSGGRVKNDTTNSIPTATQGMRSTDYEFTSKTGSLNLSQALIRPQSWLNYAQSKNQLRQADEQLRQAGQELILRLSQAYFDVLLAEDNVLLAGEQKAAIDEQLKQAKRYFEAGVGTITDINESQARYDTVVAQELAAQNNLEVKERAIEQLVGKMHRSLDRLGAGFSLELPQPTDVEEWLTFSLANNPQLKAQQMLFDISQQEVYKNAAAHLPTVDIVASRGRSESSGFTMVDNVAWSSTVGIQFSVPIFSGGSTQGRVNQASALKERARHALEATKRATVQSTRQEYLNVVNGVAQVAALQQAVKSNEMALYSAKKGQEAGLRTSFDVLNAQQLLFTAKRDLAQERYRYVLSRLKLRGAAGLLNEEDVSQVQSWLVK